MEGKSIEDELGQVKQQRTSGMLLYASEGSEEREGKLMRRRIFTRKVRIQDAATLFLSKLRPSAPDVDFPKRRAGS